VNSSLFKELAASFTSRFSRAPDGLSSRSPLLAVSKKESLAKKLGAHHYIDAKVQERLSRFKRWACPTDPRDSGK